MPALAELEQAWMRGARGHRLHRRARGPAARLRRPPVAAVPGAQRLSEAAGRELWLKREDLNHTGSHKINNALGQALLAKRMGKERIIAETGAGQHGVASATACALLGLECIVYMGAEDVRRQAPNVQRMELLGATVVPVDAGARTLKEAVSEAIRDWVTNVGTTHYIIGSAVGPAPYPAIVRELQRRHRRRVARPDARAGATACRRAWSPASAAARTRSGCSPASSTTPASSSSASRPRGRASRPAATARR